jgi:hypothetical protein
MNEPQITYRQLAEILLAIGVSRGETIDNNKVFGHRETGALIIYPDLPKDDPVIPRHLGMVRAVLKTYDIPIPAVFAPEIQKAS